MPRPLLEVIAVDAADARNAELGGADRIELVSEIDKQGLTPSVEVFAAARAATEFPIRVMIRGCDGFAVGDVEVLRRQAEQLRAEGAEEFVLGFLDDGAAVDLASVRAVLEVIDGCAWTFHKAIDYAGDRAAARQAIDGLPGLDFVLTSGGPFGAGEGIELLIDERGRGYRPRVLVGGGLRESHLSPLLAGGVDAFHTGKAVRHQGSWDLPVSVELVRRWRDQL